MPSGYTAILQEKPDISFADWAKQCARAFGACIMQRDDPMGDPPNVDEQPSRYHFERLEELRSKLAWLREVTDTEIDAKRTEEAAQSRTYALKQIEKTKAIEARYRRMLAMAKAWEPPTPDHAGVKKFMIEQITESIKFDCGTEYYDEQLQRLDVVVPIAEYRAAEIADIEKDIAYHEKKWNEEVARTNERNEWKRQLIASL